MVGARENVCFLLKKRQKIVWLRKKYYICVANYPKCGFLRTKLTKTKPKNTN